MFSFYIMNEDGTIEETSDIRNFAKDLQDRSIARTTFNNGSMLSSVFLGVGTSGVGGSLGLFETALLASVETFAGVDVIGRFDSASENLRFHRQRVKMLMDEDENLRITSNEERELGPDA